LASDRISITRHRFPYREEGNPPVLRPTVDVSLYLEPNGEWTTRALIDTGSRSYSPRVGVRTAFAAMCGMFENGRFEFELVACLVIG
jgi:hypothetical protein